MFTLYYMFKFIRLFSAPSKKVLLQCERSAPVFWVMHELEESPDWVQVDFLDFGNHLLKSEKMLYNTPKAREATLAQINKLKSDLILKIC